MTQKPELWKKELTITTPDGETLLGNLNVVSNEPEKVVKNAESLAQKLSSLQGLKGITSPMKETENGWIPDFESRYFQEDFPYGLHYIWQLTHKYDVKCPNIDMVYEWGMGKTNNK